MGKELKDMKGQKFGKLTVLERAENYNGNAQWICKCECGKETIVRGSLLRRGHTKSCGCYRKDAKTVHGHSRNEQVKHEYIAWKSMLERCNNPDHQNYKYYGGRGITVCKEWLDSFETFFADIGNRPSKDHSLDRIDVNGNYEPSNCRWATIYEQASNKRLFKNNKTGVKGVCFNKNSQKYVVKIGHLGQTIYLGSFDTFEEATAMRKEAEKKYSR